MIKAEKAPNVRQSRAVEGLKKLKENKKFTLSKDSAEEVHENKMQGNSVYSYLEERFDFSPAYEEKQYTEKLYGDKETYGEEGEPATGFRLYCEETGIKLPSLFTFRKEIKRFAKETEKIFQDRDTDEDTRLKGRRFYIGLQHKGKKDIKEETAF